MPASSPIQRGSWGLEYRQPLYLPPNDPHAEHRTHQSASLKLDEIFLRVDWQTLRRLPVSKSIVFNYKALFTPITEFRDEPGVPGLLVEVLKKGKRCLMEYKGTWHVEHIALPALETWKKEQIESGLIRDEGSVGTLDEYPMYPGWEKKWNRQQGF
jgi:hypothetical protein